MAIKKNGELWGWGWNNRGNLGIETRVDKDEPVKIMEGVVGVACGWAHTVAQKEDGSIWVWGYNSDNQLGLEPGHNVLVPTLHPNLRNIKCFGAIYESTWVIDEDGNFYIWGGDHPREPTLKTGVKLFVPRSKEEEWKKIFRWWFLGRQDQDCVFSILPVEILFHAVLIAKL
jgi:alpha-tubulin suppressor-like RCC1 family protein